MHLYVENVDSADRGLINQSQIDVVRSLFYSSTFTLSQQHHHIRLFI